MRPEAQPDSPYRAPQAVGPSAPRPGDLKVTVRVKRDPARQLKGQFAGRVTSDGIELTKGKSLAVVITRPAAARQLRRNVIALELDGREVELAVSRFRAYPDRLARDLTVYLNGGPEPADGNLISWWLLIPCLLLYGLPVATLGGMLPALVGVGFGSLAYTLAQRESWPAWVRLLIGMGLVIAGYATLFAVLRLIHVR